MVELRAWNLVYDSHGVAVRFDRVPLVFRGTGERSPLWFLNLNLKRTDHNTAVSRDPVKGSP